ncbi:hypothetical protein LOK49_LG04G01442 [Camellia lanceoleosa]|uniref:Uncharacterized protein n=1 Tax=Camellia lanceoleosa TaxID=1840588 RepID=A0ACC0HZ38_9ERIC|nr:hypothetical protein LOK49_LG04G01442 [Camellia lanceoleosa]
MEDAESYLDDDNCRTVDMDTRKLQSKIVEIGFWAEASSKHKNSGEGESEHSELPPISDPLCFVSSSSAFAKQHMD